MFKVDNRLRALLNEVEGDLIADIGCDHGKLSIGALVEDKCNRVIASDISANSLSKAITLAKNYNLSSKIEFRVSNGFENIPENLDTAVIAGLGGYEIRDILFTKIPIINKLLLCPHQNAMVARKAINDIGYMAIKDFIVKEGNKYYPIIVAVKGEKKYDSNELRFGLNMPESNNYYSMLKARKEVLDIRFLGKDIPDGEMKEEYQEIERCLR